MRFNSIPMPEMPRQYQCHKMVHALQIVDINEDPASDTMRLVFDDYPEVHMHPDWVKEHRAKAGGYYVVYSDGYQSYSPKDVFEEGYTLVEEAKLTDEPMLQFFTWEHLPYALAVVSKPFGQLAHRMVATLERNPERTVALRKLLEAKDCAVRALIYKAVDEKAPTDEMCYLIVNGTTFNSRAREISYRAIVEMAGLEGNPSVTCKQRGKEGYQVLPGTTVRTSGELIFSVAHTDNA